MATRSIKALYRGRERRDGAGVLLKRVFAHREVPKFDPFLLFDDFGGRDPEDYLPGFPWHPHRGIETVTYMLHGVVRHGDSMGNEGEIRDGQVQWMTAGSGIVHQEMPQRQADYLRGFQLWVNLPAADKMMDPRYRDIRATDIPEQASGDGVVVKVIAGRYGKLTGPVRDIIGDPEYLDVQVPAGRVFEHPVTKGHTAFAYVFKGEGIGAGGRKPVPEDTLALFGDGERLALEGGAGGCRFLLVSGKPIGEPVAWGGPIVMNTQAELDLAFEQFRNGTFIRSDKGNR
jgi:redox-sensitive bicupin YhaK (pirin superfamily)